MDSSKFVELPQPEEISRDSKDRAFTAYMMMFASSVVGLPLPFVNIVFSWVFHKYFSSDSRFVAFHSLQSIYSQVPVTVVNSISIVFFIINLVKFWESEEFPDLPFYYWGFVAMVVIVNILYMVFSIIAGIKAFKGRMYYMPFFGQMAYEKAFSVDYELRTKSIKQNTPPKL